MTAQESVYMIDAQKLSEWLNAPSEAENLEFKEAKSQFDTPRLIEYCAAIANEGGGHIILGVSDKIPRVVVGTQAYLAATHLNELKSRILDKLGFRVDISVVQHELGRVLVIDVPSRPVGHPVALDGKYLMRCGEQIRPMTPERLKQIFAEDNEDWFSQNALDSREADEVIRLLDTQTYFELLDLPYPTDRGGVLERMELDGLLESARSKFAITNLGAVLLARKLDMFPPSIARKAARFVIYEGLGKRSTREDILRTKGYAVGFAGLLEFVHASAPRNRFVEEVVRDETKMFPKQALRELIANALIHQDFSASGMSVMIEMYDDRIEISNPGSPPISTDRFIDEYKSRNETLANVMRRMGICEEKGSGIDKVIWAAEYNQLPAPDFRDSENRTSAVLFAHKDFKAMSSSDRIRACYQHCSLLWISNQRMKNSSLRTRFGLGNSGADSSIVSQVIAATKQAGLIKLAPGGSSSTRYASYLPWWA